MLTRILWFIAALLGDSLPLTGYFYGLNAFAAKSISDTVSGINNKKKTKRLNSKSSLFSIVSERDYFPLFPVSKKKSSTFVCRLASVGT